MEPDFPSADAYITDGGPGLALISWTTSSPSWANGQQVSVQLIDRDRYGWKTVREGDTGTSFTDNEQANGRKFVYRIRSTNKYGTSTTHSIFDWLWDSPYRDAIVDLGGHRHNDGRLLLRKHRGRERQQPCHWCARHQRHAAGGPDADREHVEHRR